MNPYPDYHFHSDCSDDAQGSVLNFADKARRRGITHLGFANHLEYMERDKPTDIIIERDTQRHLAVKADIERARQKYPDIKIFRGIEIENLWDFKPEIEAVLEAVKPEYIIMSAHYVKSQNISAARGLPFLKSNPEEVIYHGYFDEVERMIEWGRGKIIGHLDLVKRFGVRAYGPFNHERYRTRIETIVREAKRRNLVFEINTSGLYQDPKETYPGYYIFDYLKSANIDVISFGSDAHKPVHVGRGIREAMEKSSMRPFLF